MYLSCETLFFMMKSNPNYSIIHLIKERMINSLKTLEYVLTFSEVASNRKYTNQGKLKTPIVS